MTIASEIQRIKTNIANAYTSCNSKGATMPAAQNSANLATTINSIPSGTTPTGTLSITANGVYDVTNYASADVSVAGSNGVKLIVYNKNSDPAQIYLELNGAQVEPIVEYLYNTKRIGGYWEIAPNTNYILKYNVGSISQTINISSDQWIVVNLMAPP